MDSALLTFLSNQQRCRGLPRPGPARSQSRALQIPRRQHRLLSLLTLFIMAVPSTAPQSARLFPLPRRGSAEAMARVLSTRFTGAEPQPGSGRGSRGQGSAWPGWHLSPPRSQARPTLGETVLSTSLPPQTV